MSEIQITDNSIWTKQIANDEALRKRLIAMSQGHLVELEIDGFRGLWRKMLDGRDGRRTDGLKPFDDKTSVWWQAQQSRRGATVSIREIIE
jgi:hypothetical protein